MPQWVLKVFPGHRGYMNLYMLAKKTNNVHFPHVGRMGRLLIPGKPPVEDASVLAVMIERLAPSGPLHDEVVDAARQYAWHHEKVDFISQEYPEFYPAMEMIVSRVSQSGVKQQNRRRKIRCNFDIKQDNILYRGDTPVFTDLLV